MSDYEKINAGVKLAMSARRKAAVKKIILVLVKILAAMGFFIGLKAIGFISLTFMVILMAITVCIGAFNTGWICRDIKF